MGGGLGGSSFGPSELSASAQDTSADSNVFNTQGPSANHGSISFNFHVNNENFTSPLGNTSKGSSNHQVDELTMQNDLLKKIISQIAPSIIPTGARRKRSIRSRPWRTWRVCSRPSPLCPPKALWDCPTSHHTQSVHLLSDNHLFQFFEPNRITQDGSLDFSTNTI